ncbi:hypothetical protein MATL_G00110220 [Megalops atlanticus]|uniref:Uncharacterized protein n=1 Tax=Megalops atlanticus TaxID=7932 RepID=A0A9D3Q0L2_MEGAT|nr:hypothetical protein MATL_G00110220 [Megalops atlanticus]
MSGVSKKSAAGPSGIKEWISSACRFATDRNDFRRNLLAAFRESSTCMSVKEDWMSHCCFPSRWTKIVKVMYSM